MTEWVPETLAFQNPLDTCWTTDISIGPQPAASRPDANAGRSDFGTRLGKKSLFGWNISFNTMHASFPLLQTDAQIVRHTTREKY
jgi:hypothetical protein